MDSGKPSPRDCLKRLVLDYFEPESESENIELIEEFLCEVDLQKTKSNLTCFNDYFYRAFIVLERKYEFWNVLNIEENDEYSRATFFNLTRMTFFKNGWIVFEKRDLLRIDVDSWSVFKFDDESNYMEGMILWPAFKPSSRTIIKGFMSISINNIVKSFGYVVKDSDGIDFVGSYIRKKFKRGAYSAKRFDSASKAIAKFIWKFFDNESRSFLTSCFGPQNKVEFYDFLNWIRVKNELPEVASKMLSLKRDRCPIIRNVIRKKTVEEIALIHVDWSSEYKVLKYFGLEEIEIDRIQKAPSLLLKFSGGFRPKRLGVMKERRLIYFTLEEFAYKKVSAIPVYDQCAIIEFIQKNVVDNFLKTNIRTLSLITEKYARHRMKDKPKSGRWSENGLNAARKRVSETFGQMNLDKELPKDWEFNNETPKVWLEDNYGDFWSEKDCGKIETKRERF